MFVGARRLAHPRMLRRLPAAAAAAVCRRRLASSSSTAAAAAASSPSTITTGPSYAEALSAVTHSPPPLGADGLVAVDGRADTCYTLPAAAYTSPAIFREEQATIFRDAWAYADHTSNLPTAGCYSTARVGDEELILVRDKAMQVRAFYNVCPHRAHRVVEPGSRGRRAVLVCPNHAWSFKLDGSLHRARRTEGQPAFDPVEFGLKEVRIADFHGLLFVNLSPDAPELFADAPELPAKMEECILRMDDMRLEARVEREVEANWKVLGDNFLECYHCDTAHKDFVDMVDMDAYVSEVHPRYVYNYSPCRPDNAAYAFKPDDPCQAIHYFWLWPNTVIYTAPGPANMSMLEFIPLSPTRTLRRAQRFFAGADGDADDNDAADAAADDDDDAARRDAAVSYVCGAVKPPPRVVPASTQDRAWFHRETVLRCCVVVAPPPRRRQIHLHRQQPPQLVQQTTATTTQHQNNRLRVTLYVCGAGLPVASWALLLAVVRRYLNDVLLEEDTGLCESMQRGMASQGFQQGRLVISPTDSWETEKALAQFHALCHARLSAGR